MEDDSEEAMETNSIPVTTNSTTSTTTKTKPVVPGKTRIVVQSDWDSGGIGAKSWLMLKTPGVTSSKDEFVKDQLSEDGAETTTPNDFSIRKHRSTLLSVKHPRAPDSALFLAPSSSWPINLKKSVVCLDVTQGGLGVSVNVFGDARVWTTTNGESRRRLIGHPDAIYATKFFPSGTVILTGGADFRLKIWAAESGACAATLTGHRGAINAVDIVDRGRNVVSGGSDFTVKLWDVGRSDCLYSFDSLAIGIINGLAIGAAEAGSGGNGASTGNGDHAGGGREVGTDGKYLLVAGEGGLGGGGRPGGYLVGLGLKDRRRCFTVKTPAPVNAVANMDDRVFAYGLHNGVVAVADIRNVNKPLYSEQQSRGAVFDVRAFRTGFLFGTNDGSAVYVPRKRFDARVGACNNNEDNVVLDLTGPDCDPVYKMAPQGGNVVFTACRDGYVRKYLLDEAWAREVE